MPKRRMISNQMATFTAEGQSITGKLTEKGTQTIMGREVGRYVLANDVANIVFNGSVQLDEAFREAAVGEMIEVIYKGTAKTSNGFSVKLFEVYVLEEDGADA